MGCYFLFQGIFSIQGWNPQLLCVLHWQVDSLLLCHLGSPCLNDCSWIWDSVFPIFLVVESMDFYKRRALRVSNLCFNCHKLEKWKVALGMLISFLVLLLLLFFKISYTVKSKNKRYLIRRFPYSRSLWSFFKMNTRKSPC